MLDGSNGAFVDLDLEGNAVTRLWHHFGFHSGRIATLGNILALQFVSHALEGRALEDFTFGEAGLLQAFHQVFGGDRLVTLDLDA
ncbi:hypothetical protein D9M71_604810 [compost metagenome]